MLLPRLFTLQPVEQVLWLPVSCFMLPGAMSLCMQEGCGKGIGGDVCQNTKQKMCAYYAKKARPI